MQNGARTVTRLWRELWENLLASAANPNYKQPILSEFPGDSGNYCLRRKSRFLKKLYGVFIVASVREADWSKVSIPIREKL